MPQKVNMSNVSDNVCQRTGVRTKKYHAIVNTREGKIPNNPSWTQRWHMLKSTNPAYCGPGYIAQGGLAQRLYQAMGNGKKPNGVHYNKKLKGDIWVTDTGIAARIDLIVNLFQWCRRNKGKWFVLHGKRIRIFATARHDTRMIANVVLMYAALGRKKVDTMFSIASGSCTTDTGWVELYHKIRFKYDTARQKLHESMQKHIGTTGAGGQNLPLNLGSRERFKVPQKTK